jgi:hypothetical protein
VCQRLTFKKVGAFFLKETSRWQSPLEETKAGIGFGIEFEFGFKEVVMLEAQKRDSLLARKPRITW